MIISVLNEKGGVGKTTLTTNIAYAFKINTGKSVLLVDADPQGSSRDWHANGNGELLDVVGLDRPTLDKDVLKFKRHYEVIFIDTGRQINDMTVKALICSDIVLIPVQPSPYDIWSSKILVDLIKQRQDVANGKPNAAFIVSRQIVGTKIGKEVREVLQGYNLPVFKHGTYQRICYPMTAAEGKTVFNSADDIAVQEMNLIANELSEYMTCLS